MQNWIGFSLQIAAMSVLTALFEQLVPDGPLKSSALTGAGLVFTAAISAQIAGIFGGTGV